MNFQFKNNSLEYCALHDALDRYYAPMFGETETDKSDWKAPVRAQLEMWGLASRRARATLELSGQLATCRSPAGVIAAYTNYWQGAFHDCAESTRRIAEAVSSGHHIQVRAEQPEPAPEPVAEPVRLKSRKELSRFNGTHKLADAELRAS